MVIKFFFKEKEKAQEFRAFMEGKGFWMFGRHEVVMPIHPSITPEEAKRLLEESGHQARIVRE